MQALHVLYKKKHYFPSNLVTFVLFLDEMPLDSDVKISSWFIKNQ